MAHKFHIFYLTQIKKDNVSIISDLISTKYYLLSNNPLKIISLSLNFLSTFVVLHSKWQFL